MNAENPLVVIGMDPHKRTVTIEVMTSHEQVDSGGRFTSDTDGYAQMLGYARQWPQRPLGGRGLDTFSPAPLAVPGA